MCTTDPLTLIGSVQIVVTVYSLGGPRFSNSGRLDRYGGVDLGWVYMVYTRTYDRIRRTTSVVIVVKLNVPSVSQQGGDDDCRKYGTGDGFLG